MNELERPAARGHLSHTEGRKNTNPPELTRTKPATPGERLQEFDRDLCDYVVGNIRQHLNGVTERPTPEPDISPGAWNALDFPGWFSRQFIKYMPALGDHVWAGVFGETPRLPLSDAELKALVSAVDDPPMRVENLCVWEPYPALHAQYVECVPEIRTALTQQTAEEWATASSVFAAKLSQEPLTLTQGIGVVHDWLRHLRRLLRLMGATDMLPYPLGTHATPTHPNPQAQCSARVESVTVTGNGRGNCVVKEKPHDSAVCGWQEAMAITGLKKTKLYDLFGRGVLRGYRDGTMIRFYRTGLNAYMKERENTPAAAPLRPARRPRKSQSGTTMRLKFLPASGCD